MNALSKRYDRNIRLFGIEGQRKLQAFTVVVVGVGGLGSSVAQHLALLGLGRVTLIDDEELDETNRNRFIGARHDDPIPGSKKVVLSARLIREVNPDVEVNPIVANLVSEEAFAAVKATDAVFGCFDDDGPRAILNELCAAYKKPYFDLASDVPEPGAYGGRVCVAWDGSSCLLCMGELDTRAVQRYLQTDSEREAHDRIYGVDKAALGREGPSVSTINGVVAALGVTEFMVAITGMRSPARMLNYRAHVGTVSRVNNPKPNCFIWKSVRGQMESADVERYLRLPHIKNRR
jgi:molybdopterin-synthase adenylyltransferase